MKMSKQKGTSFEREILQLFWKDTNWAALRTPGSGSARFPSPDIIAGSEHRRIAIECKSTQKKSQYFTKEEIEQLKEFSRRFHAEPWVAIKFGRIGHYFLPIEELEETPKFYVVTVQTAQERGLAFAELVGRPK